MKHIITLLSCLFALNAFAHVTPGKYEGQDQNGKPCTFTVGDSWFEDNVAHALNERLPVSHIAFNEKFVDEVIWNLAHPPVVSLDFGTNRINHNLFQQIIPSKSGAVSVTLLINDEKRGEQPPYGIVYINDNYRSQSQSSKMACTLKK